MQHTSGRRRAGRSGLLVLGLLAMVAAGCGGSDDEAGDGGGGGSDTTVTGANTDVTCRAGFDPEDPDADEDGEPQFGGRLVYALEAETDGWYGPSNRWSLSGLQIANSIYDTLTKVGVDGKFYPWLAESVEPNEAYDVWTITIRDGVVFHDGTPLTADAVVHSLEAFRTAPLTQAALSNIQDDGISALDEVTVEVRMKEPWVPFPQYLSSQVGVVFSPAMEDDPEKNDHPVGTGPFEMESWERDSALVVVRNDEYWATDDAGNQLPYLDSVEYRPIPDPVQRKAALDSGDIQAMHTFTADQISEFREDAEAGELNAYESCAWGEDEEFLLMFNSGDEPFNDPIAREAVSRAIDREALIQNIFGDTFQIANGPYAPGSPWYSEPTAEQEQTYDPARARELAEQYEAEHGEPLTFSIGAPSSIPEALQSQQLMQGYLEEAGIEVQLEQVEYATYLVNALAGNYDANIWRQFGAPDPDGDYVWWHPDNVNEVGQSSLNIARFEDAEMGEALDRGRQSADPEERKAAYADVQRIFRDNFYLGWSAHAFWSVAATSNVHDLVNWTMPSGEQGMPLVGGQHPISQVWLSQ
jgi:ABC-type transport system substrate-binding protein